MNSERVVVVNGGSSTVKLAVYTADPSPALLVKAQVERVGQPDSAFRVARAGSDAPDVRPVRADDHGNAAHAISDWLDEAGAGPVRAIGHRVVHGGIDLNQHQLITRDLVGELRAAQCLDLAHLPREIAMIEAFAERYPDVAQVACFDTAFHRDLPRVAQLLPIPRRFISAGIRRLGFHGLSYTYLLQALEEAGGPTAANGRVILAHLGSGASMAAVHERKPVDTSMGFTPAAGLVMGTRPGDMDPGLLLYMMRTEKLSPEQMDAFISRACGLAGVSDGTSDVRELLARRATDERAAEAIELFCYSAKKYIGAYVAALGGLDTLVFSGGVGEHAAAVRAGICNGLDWLGITLDDERNAASAAVISSGASRVVVRVIPTDEERVMAAIVLDVIAARNRSM